MPGLRNKLRGIADWVRQHPVRAGAIAGWFQQAASVGVGLLLVPVVLSKFPLPESGLWFGFQGMMAMVGLLDFGIGAVVARQAAHISGGGRAKSGEDFIDFGVGSKALRALIDHAGLVYKITGTLLIVAGIVIFEAIIPHTRFLEGVSIDSRPVWYLMLLVPLSILLASRASSLLIGTGHLFSVRVLLGCFFVVQGLSVGIVAWWWQDLRVMACVSALAAAAYALVVTGLCRRMSPDIFNLPQSPRDWTALRKLLGIAAPMGVVNVSAFFFTSIQVPLVAMLLGPAVVAPFYLAQRILQAGMTAVLNLFQPQLPRFTRQISAGDRPGAWVMVRRNLAVGYPATFLVAAVFVLTSPWIAALLAKSEVFPSRSILIWMGIDAALCTCTVIGNQFVLASGRNPFVTVTLVAGGLNVLLLYLLIPQAGLAGVPFAAIISGGIAAYWFAFLQLVRLRNGLLGAESEVPAI